MKHWHLTGSMATCCGIPLVHADLSPEFGDIECNVCRHVALFDVQLEKDREHFARCEALLGIPGRENVRTLDDVRAGIEAAVEALVSGGGK